MVESTGRRKPSPALVISLVALFVSLGGVAWAAATIDSGDVQNDSLKSVDLKNDKAVKSADVVDDSLRGADIQESSLGPVPNATDADTLGGLDSGAFGYGITSVSYNPSEAATEYVPGLGSSFGPASATESSVDLMSASAPLIARDLRVRIEGPPPGPGNLWTITLREDGASTGLSCDIVGSIVTTICTDSGPSTTIGVGSHLALEVVPVGGPNPASTMDIAFRYGPG